MPRKIRELIRDLERAGFVNRGGKGSHRNYQHPAGSRMTVSGRMGDDAKPYQERELKIVLVEVTGPPPSTDPGPAMETQE